MNNITVAIIAINLIVSITGFNNASFRERYLFSPYAILKNKEYDRLITSGFLHANWMHFIFNMLSLYFFADEVVMNLGRGGLVLIYLGGLVGGNLLSLLLNKDNFSYRALGASGAVSAVIFSAVVCNPEIQLIIYFIPVPGWLFAIGYTVYSIYGILKELGDNIGHDAHLGGSIAGLLITGIIDIEFITRSPILSMAITAPFIAFIIYRFNLHKSLKPKKSFRNADLKVFRKSDFSIESEINHLLEKITEVGYGGLTDAEKARLDELSKLKKTKAE